jgi:hypothetical protein
MRLPASLLTLDLTARTAAGEQALALGHSTALAGLTCLTRLRVPAGARDYVLPPRLVRLVCAVGAALLQLPPALEFGGINLHGRHA